MKDVFLLLDIQLEISPNYKYFVLQEWQGSHDPNIYKEINEMMEHNSPIWVLAEKTKKKNSEMNEKRNSFFWEKLEKSYILYQGSRDKAVLMSVVRKV